MPLLEETFDSNRSQMNRQSENQNRNLQLVELSNYRTLSEEQVKFAIRMYFKVIDKVSEQEKYRDLLGLIGHPLVAESENGDDSKQKSPGQKLIEEADAQIQEIN